jgi:hypothetical protein
MIANPVDSVIQSEALHTPAPLSGGHMLPITAPKETAKFIKDAARKFPIKCQRVDCTALDCLN